MCSSLTRILWSARRRVWSLGAVALLLAMAAPAQADLTALARDLAGLRSDIGELRRIQLVQATDPGDRAHFEVRLGQLEEELRRLTGRVEQLEFGQRTLESRIDQLVQDLDVRLSTLERGAAAPGTIGPEGQQSGAAGSGTGESASGAPAASADAGQVEAGDSEDPAIEGTLGQVPESALLDLPRPDPAAATPPESTGLPAQRQYDSAMDLLRAGDYTSAERGLELFLDLNPDHPLASNAAYWLAETFYVRKNYAAAASGFARNYRTYGKSAPKAPDNLLKLGMSLLGLGEAEKACLSYTELAKEFPNAPTHIEQAVSRERARADCA
jgi:tol-pal system protein YbgF